MQIAYSLSFAPAQHLIDVTIDVTQITAPQVDLSLPVWTPGSYLIREYARHVQEVRAWADDQPCAWRKLDKHTWRVFSNGAATLRFSYRVYGHELSVRTNHVDDTHAHVIPAATLMAVQGATQQPLTLEVRPPQGWQVATGLEQRAPGLFVADDYDHLVDAPLEIGTHRELRFSVDGRPHRIVIWGRGNEDEARLIADTQRIVEVQRDFWGGLPYAHYTFFLLLGDDEARGGLEHRNSTSLLLPRFTFRDARRYERYLTLVSHEFFHVWNVKRLRAAGLGPFDYGRETYTTLLWVMEGLTEYYTDLLLVRAGLLTPERYLERLADDILKLQSTPGRALQSLECSSWDTWIKLYRPDENSDNTSISYYLKGAIIGALLDLEIRRRTANRHSLDAVMRWLYRAYPLDGPGLPDREAVLAALQEVTDQDFSDFFARYIGGVDELPYDQVFAAAGLRLSWDWSAEQAGRPWLGLRTRSNGGLKVASVLRDGPAYAAGISPGDEIIAVDGWRVRSDEALRERLGDRRPGEQTTILVARRDELRSYTVTLAAAPVDRLRIERVEQPDALQQRIYASWLGQDQQGGAYAAQA